MGAVTAASPPELARAGFRYPRLMRRIERLINLIAALLEAPSPMTADDIRERIAGYDQDSRDAFRRTFERDKEALRAMGIPIETTQVDPLGMDTDGYIIPKARYYLPQLDLEPDELAALRIAAEAILGGTEAAHAGLMKLTVDAETAPTDGPRIVWGADLASEQPLLASLYSALLDLKPVTFSYQTAGSDVATARTVEPYGLLHRRGHWYVVGRDPDRDAIRAFKVSRIRAPVRPAGGAYDIPAGFDANAHLAGEPWEVGPDQSTSAVVRFSPKLRWWADQNLPDAHRRETSDGALDVEMPVSNVDALVSWAIGFGDEVEIIEPAEARRALVARLSAVAEAAQ
jgi:proteasome accessory factor B